MSNAIEMEYNETTNKFNLNVRDFLSVIASKSKSNRTLVVVPALLNPKFNVAFMDKSRPLKLFNHNGKNATSVELYGRYFKIWDDFHDFNKDTDDIKTYLDTFENDRWYMVKKVGDANKNITFSYYWRAL